MHLKVGVVLVLICIVACQPEVVQIQYGKDQCQYCKMTISDRKYGGELVTQKGKTFKFDAVECMLDYIIENEEHYVFQMAVPYDIPGKLRPADSLTYLISSNLPSPMGEFLTAFSHPSIAQEFQQEKGGEVYNWPGIQSKIED